MTVTAEQRHTRAHRCPVCDGADGDPRGKSKRCSGFTSSDGEYAHCSREELAGCLEQEDAGTYAHRLHGPCKCGVEHGADNRTRDEIEAIYPYTDEAGSLLFEVVRKAGKRFLQRKPDGCGGWTWKVNGVRRTLYRLTDLVADDADRTVYFVEGEKDVETLTRRGFLATCTPGGAEKPGQKAWREGVAEHARTVLHGRDVVVVGDADAVGRDFGRLVADGLRPVARSIRVVECTRGKDITEHLAAGGTLDELVPLADKPPEDPEETDDHARKPVSLVDRARAIRARGPVVRLATGLPTFDAACRGGLAVPRLVVVGGAPGAGKTALVVWLALLWARQGVEVLVLAVDEAADDILMRLALEEGCAVDRLEQGDEAEWERFEQVLAALPLTVVDGDEGWTLESAAACLAKRAPKGPAVLVVDSTQTVAAEGTESASNPRERVDAVVAALKRVVKAHPFLVLATSELARGAYRSRNNADHINDLASFKESGGVEYAAQTALVLRSLEGELVDVSVPKNRGGRKDGFTIEIDARTRVREVSRTEGDEEHEDRASHQVDEDVLVVEKVLVEAGEVAGVRGLRAELRARGAAMGNVRIDAAVARLGARIVNRGASNRPRWVLEQREQDAAQ